MISISNYIYREWLTVQHHCNSSAIGEVLCEAYSSDLVIHLDRCEERLSPEGDNKKLICSSSDEEEIRLKHQDVIDRSQCMGELDDVKN